MTLRKSLLLGAAAAAMALPTASPAQPAAAATGQDLTKLPPVPTSYKPKKTEWGEPDFRGGWPID